MDPATLDAATLKAIFQEQSLGMSARVVAFGCAALLATAVLDSVRRRELQEDLTPIWLTCALAFLTVAISFDLLIWLTNALGAWTPSSTIFFLLLAFLMAISMSYAIRISKLSNQVRVLAQELALLKVERAEPPASAL
jgi:hypothetical protein